MFFLGGGGGGGGGGRGGVRTVLPLQSSWFFPIGLTTTQQM